MKKIFSIFVMCGFLADAQVGISKNQPTSTLDINGSVSANYRQVTATTYAIVTNDHYITYNGTANSTFTLPAIGSGASSFTGRIYIIDKTKYPIFQNKMSKKNILSL